MEARGESAASDDGGGPVNVAQQSRAHHRRQRQRNDRRSHHGDRQRQREFAEHSAYKAGHKEQRYENRNQRHRQRNDREPDLLCAAQGRLQRAFAIFHVTHDVLDHDDGVVDHKARAYRQGHERQVVEGKSAEPHHAESCDQ